MVAPPVVLLQRTRIVATYFFALSLCLEVNAYPPGQEQKAQQSFPSLRAIEEPTVEVRSASKLQVEATHHFVITHGMGGTVGGDRFHLLADAIGRQLPKANVLILDWTDASSATIGMLPDPWRVAGRIRLVAKQATGLLAAVDVDPAKTTLIGESFGNNVNALIAQQFGGVKRILAFNPANELAGYPTPNLRKCAKISWSFHTYSVYDAVEEIAHAGIFLETPPTATDWQQHVAGIGWLSARLLADDRSWLLAEKSLPKPRANHFHAFATLTGQLSDKQLPRERPITTDDVPSSVPSTRILALPSREVMK